MRASRRALKGALQHEEVLDGIQKGPHPERARSAQSKDVARRSNFKLRHYPLSAIFSLGATEAAAARLWNRSGFWRHMTAVLATVALALLVAALVARAPANFADRTVIATVRDQGRHPLWAIRLARTAHQIAIDSLAPPSVPAGRVYQLWLVVPDGGTPRPLGLLPQTGRKVIAETPANSRLLSGRGELVVTLEAKGGSQRPGPSGPATFRARLDHPSRNASGSLPE